MDDVKHFLSDYARHIREAQRNLPETLYKQHPLSNDWCDDTGNVVYRGPTPDGYRRVSDIPLKWEMEDAND